jgi:N utilization substance protein A
VEALADMTPEELEAIPGIDAETIEKISVAVNNYFSSLDSQEQSAEPVEAEYPSDSVLAEASGLQAEAAESAEEPADTAAEAQSPESEDRETEPESGSAKE